ncbi:hypothetical protein Nmel_007789 [Mimus melanotis]
MSPTLPFILVLLATLTRLKVNLNTDKDEVQWMQEHEEYLHQEMTRPLKEMEESSGTMEALLSLSLQQQCLLWASAAALLLALVAMGCWLVSRRKRSSASSREQEGAKRKKGVSSKKVSSEKSGYEKIKSNEEGKVRGSQAKLGSKEKSFMPELHPAPECCCEPSSECCSIQENCSAYCPLVILRPPPGYSFHLDSTERPPARRIRVALECLCSGEQLLPPWLCWPAALGSELVPSGQPLHGLLLLWPKAVPLLAPCHAPSRVTEGRSRVPTRAFRAADTVPPTC